MGSASTRNCARRVCDENGHAYRQQLFSTAATALNPTTPGRFTNEGILVVSPTRASTTTLLINKPLTGRSRTHQMASNASATAADAGAAAPAVS